MREKMLLWSAVIGLSGLLLSGLPAAADTECRSALQNAMAMAKDGRSERAIEEVRYLLRQPGNAENVEAQVTLGLLCYRAKRYDDALAAFSRTLELRPNHPMALYFLGMIYEKKALTEPDETSVRSLKTRALDAWQNYLACADTGHPDPAAHRNIGITVKESVRRAQRHVRVLKEELCK